MIRERITQKNSVSIITLSLLLLLPNCGVVDWVKDKFGGGSSGSNSDQPMTNQYDVADNSEVLATIDGKPLITKNMLEKEKQRLIESNPQLQAMIALMDEKQLDRNLMDGMASREVIRKYVKENKIQESEKYKKDFEMVLSQVRDALNTRFFMEAFAEQASDTETRKYYDDNKDGMPNLLISRGGVEAKAVAFKDRQEAKDFANKIKAAKHDIDKAVKDANLKQKVENFRLVNEDSMGMDEELRNRIISIKSYPRVEVIKSGNDFYAVVALRKEEPKYRPFEQVKAELKQAIEKEKTMKRFEDEVARLKGEYQIEVNESFFSAAPLDNAAAMQAQNEDVDFAAQPEQTAQAESTQQSVPAVTAQADQAPAAAPTQVV